MNAWIKKKERKVRRDERTVSRQARAKFYATPAWRTLSDAYLMRYPLCELCEAEGRVKTAEEVHHIFSPFEHGERYGLDPNNLISLCKDCHGRIHGEKKESTLYHLYGRHDGEF